jgi:acyl-CoA synthetase (AMP-forming)/AMP-acid ligase II
MRNLSDDLVKETYNGVQVLNFKRRPRNIRQILQTAVERFPDKNAFECNSDVRTYAEFSRDVDRLASAMQKAMGIRKGERIALLLGNGMAFPLSFFAAARIGAISVPINTRFVTDEIAFVLNNCSASAVIVHPNHLKECLRAKHSSPALKHVVVAGSAGLAPDCLDLASLMKGSEAEPDEVDVHENDPACIFYTAGTMGKTKGALCAHRNIVSNCLNVEAVTGITSDDRQLVCVPFFHPTGCHAQLTGGVHVGCTMVIQRHFNADEMLTLVQKAKISRLVGVPTTYWLLLAQMNLKDYDYSSVQSVIYGGAPASPELIRRLRETFPSARLGNGYGLTESSSLATFLPDEFALEKSDSVGPPVPTVDVCIANDEGLEIAPGKIGEILLKGPNIVNGYWQDSEATSETFTRGWLRTGDLGRIDGDGFLYVVDRKKDIIIRGGENIYSVEIENVLESHAGVFEAAVVGEPDKVFGEQVKAYVVPNPGFSLSVDGILDFCDERLADFKIPKYIEFVEALPRNAAGKVDKRALRR